MKIARKKLNRMSPPEADLYLDQIDVRRYCRTSAQNRTREHCRYEEEKTCIDDCPLLEPQQQLALNTVLRAKDFLPSVPSITVPRPIDTGLNPVNNPDGNSMVLVTANSSLTFDVLLAVWSQGVTPAWFLLVDCLGNTVDMAMVFGEFKAERLAQALSGSGAEDQIGHRRMIVPGLTAPLAKDFEKATGWEVEIGPICAAELPLFLGDRWESV